MEQSPPDSDQRPPEPGVTARVSRRVQGNLIFAQIVVLPEAPDSGPSVARCSSSGVKDFPDVATGIYERAHFPALGVRPMPGFDGRCLR